MKMFVGKINPAIMFIQKFPHGKRKSKHAIQNRTLAPEQTGVTGEKLIDCVEKLVGQDWFQNEEFDGILIEDDRDDRFLMKVGDGSSALDIDAWNDFRIKATERIQRIAPDIPVVILCASPEVESWFLLDWSNSFGSVYQEDFTAAQNAYFSHTFHEYVKTEILGTAYQEHVESFGCKNGRYVKLSELLQAALDEHDFLENFGPKDEHPTVRYSKRTHGSKMLEELVPEVVAQNCGDAEHSPFHSAYHQLKSFTAQEE